MTKRKRKMQKNRATRRITAPVRERLDRLAEVLADFLPMTSSSSNTTTFRTIFAESRVEHYLDVDARNKTQQLQKGLVELYRRHEKLPFTVVRKIVPAAVRYRKAKRRPLKRDEVEALGDCLADLGIDMVEELGQIELDENLPRITVPPRKLKEWLREHDLDLTIASEPLELFEAGHFNEAVRKAAERFESRVREAYGLNAYGHDLMAKAFSDGSRINLAALRLENREAFQRGYKLLAMGMMASIRNVFSHGDEERRAPEECFELLLFINWLSRALNDGR